MGAKRTKTKEDIVERILVGLSYTFRLLIVVEAVTAAWNKQLFLLILSLVILVLTFLPSFIAKNYKINVPAEIEFIIVIFISSSLFLGETKDFYTKFWWWDIFLHSISSLLLGFIGFLLMYILYTEKRVRATPGLVAVFAFCFSVAFGVLWEIVEFIIDQTLGWNMQSSGLVDTMWDLIVDSMSALVISVSGYFYLKRKQATPFFERFLMKFIEKNPHLFRRKSRR